MWLLSNQRRMSIKYSCNFQQIKLTLANALVWDSAHHRGNLSFGEIVWTFLGGKVIKIRVIKGKFIKIFIKLNNVLNQTEKVILMMFFETYPKSTLLFKDYSASQFHPRVTVCCASLGVQLGLPAGLLLLFWPVANWTRLVVLFGSNTHLASPNRVGSVLRPKKQKRRHHFGPETNNWLTNSWFGTT